MSHADTMRQFYERVNARDVDGFAALLADDLIEHEEIEGLPQTKEGVIQFFTMLLAAFPDVRMDAEDIIDSDDSAWARIRITGTGEVGGSGGRGNSERGGELGGLLEPQTTSEDLVTEDDTHATVGARVDAVGGQHLAQAQKLTLDVVGGRLDVRRQHATGRAVPVVLA